jgi:hypothetical protein
MHGHSRLQRNPRVDIPRGFTLLRVFLDHIPGNTLATLTLIIFGFTDPAELFVILAGLSSMMAYGKRFERNGIRSGLRRITARCLRLDLYRGGLLLTLMIIACWSVRQNVRLEDFAPFLSDSMTVVKRGLELQALPSGVDILPLYTVLICFFPSCMPVGPQLRQAPACSNVKLPHDRQRLFAGVT